jgi:hypothetical protein
MNFLCVYCLEIVCLLYIAMKFNDDHSVIIVLLIDLCASVPLAADMENAKAVGWILKIGISDSAALF